MATQVDIPSIGDSEAMPKAKRGRVGMDLTPIIEKLTDHKTHYFEGITDSKSKEKWSRKVREAADKAGLGVKTTFSPSESRLYFEGKPKANDAAKPARKNGRKKQEVAA